MNNALDKIWILNDSVWNKSDLYFFWKIHTPVLNKNILDIMSVYANSFCACNIYATSTKMCVLFLHVYFSIYMVGGVLCIAFFVILPFIPMYFMSKWSCLVITRMRFLYVLSACTLFFTLHVCASSEMTKMFHHVSTKLQPLTKGHIWFISCFCVCDG